MMCEECGIRPARFHLTTISGEERKDMSLCPVCFAKYQKKLPGIDISGLAGILSGILEAGAEQADKAKDDEQHAGLVCDSCGETYSEFKRIGTVGCTHCYNVFREPIEALLTKINGNTHYAGRIPGCTNNSASIKMNIERMRRQLSRAVADEAYEDAALLRDRIRALSKQLDENPESQGGAADGK